MVACLESRGGELAGAVPSPHAGIVGRLARSMLRLEYGIPGVHAGGASAGTSSSLEKSLRGPTISSSRAAARDAARISRAAREGGAPEPSASPRAEKRVLAAAERGRARLAALGGSSAAAWRRPACASKIAWSLADGGRPRCSIPPTLLGRCLAAGAGV
eukprot:scaffold244920_cov24-Tisochrysis_lutea.AAC.4